MEKEPLVKSPAPKETLLEQVEASPFPWSLMHVPLECNRVSQAKAFLYLKAPH